VKFLLILAALAGGAWHFYQPLPPGEGPNADAGKRAATVVLRTLENYRGERGHYPEDLADLVPKYLSKLPRLSNGVPFEYERLGSSYELTFNYTNPLPVHCTFRPDGKWSCTWF
jgi:hypothetical protein